MTDDSQLPDGTDELVLAKWLRDKPRPLVLAFATRMALLALPGLGALTPQQMAEGWARAVVSTTFRAIAASFAATQYPTRYASTAASTPDIAAPTAPLKGQSWVRAFVSAAVRAVWAPFVANQSPTRYVSSEEAAADAARSASDAASSTYAASACNAASAAADCVYDDSYAGYGGYAADAASGAYASDAAVRHICALRKREIEAVAWAMTVPDGVSQYFRMPIWPAGSLPPEIGEAWANLKTTLTEQNAGWTVWIEWAEARFFDRDDWPIAVYDELNAWRDKWDRSAGEVNQEIAALLAVHEPKPSAPIASFKNGDAQT